jgi:alpha-glucosidase (family GH31 glycosyl hydrolase)
LKLYGNLKKFNSLLSARNEKLESEYRELLVENSVLKSEIERRVEETRSVIERQKAIEQDFERRAYQKAIEYGNRFKEIKNGYLVGNAKSTQTFKAMEASERHQMSQLHKINVPFELSNNRCRKRIYCRWRRIEESHYQGDGVNDLKVGR